MSVDSRTKFVQLSYDDITTSIGNGVLDEYDMCITKDTHEIYVIRDDLTPFAIKSKDAKFLSDINNTVQIYILFIIPTD